jgi:hypothetical protein
VKLAYVNYELTWSRNKKKSKRKWLHKYQARKPNERVIIETTQFESKLIGSKVEMAVKPNSSELTTKEREREKDGSRYKDERGNVHYTDYGERVDRTVIRVNNR